MELMVTVMIVGVLAMVALPNMSGFLKGERLTTQINSLLSHLQYARSEAVLRHQQIVVCASSDGASCNGGWNEGWIVFTDNDADGSVSGTDTVLKARGKLQGDSVLGSSAGASIIYDRRGFTPNSDATFSLCDNRGAEYGKSIAISKTGRVRNVKGEVTCP